MLYPAVEGGRVAGRVREREVHPQRSDACRSCRTRPSSAEILLAPRGLSRTVALSFRKYSLSKDIYDK